MVKQNKLIILLTVIFALINTRYSTLGGDARAPLTYSFLVWVRVGLIFFLNHVYRWLDSIFSTLTRTRVVYLHESARRVLSHTLTHTDSFSWSFDCFYLLIPVVKSEFEVREWAEFFFGNSRLTYLLKSKGLHPHYSKNPPKQTPSAHPVQEAGGCVREDLLKVRMETGNTPKCAGRNPPCSSPTFSSRSNHI